MRKNTLLIFIFILIFILSSCTNGPLFIKDNDNTYGFDEINDKSEEIDNTEEVELSENKEVQFVIRKINYYKEIDVQNDRVELDKNDSSLLSMVIKPCLTNDIELTSIVYKKGKFHIKLKSNSSSKNVSTPYISVKLLNKLPDGVEADDFVFDKENIKTIEIKYTKDNAINYVKQKYNLIANLPDAADLVYVDKPIWKIKYKFVYDKNDYDHPIKNLNIDFDANAGKVLSVREEDISKFIDNGSVFSINTKLCMYYNKKLDDTNNIYIYDINKAKSKIITTFKGDIKSVYKSNTSDDIIINYKEKGSLLKSIIYSKGNDECIKIAYKDEMNIIDANIKNKDSIIAIDKNEKNESIIYEINLQDESYFEVFRAEDNIVRASYINDYYVYLSKYDINQMLYITKDFENYDFIDEVENYYFADEKSFVYLSNNKLEGTCLYEYNLKERFYKKIVSGDYAYINKEDNAYILAEKDKKHETYDLLLYKLDNNDNEEFIFKNLDNLNLYLSHDLKKLFKSTKVIDKNYTKNIIYEINI